MYIFYFIDIYFRLIISWPTLRESRKQLTQWHKWQEIDMHFLITCSRIIFPVRAYVHSVISGLCFLSISCLGISFCHTRPIWISALARWIRYHLIRWAMEWHYYQSASQPASQPASHPATQPASQPASQPADRLFIIHLIWDIHCLIFVRGMMIV